MSAAEGKNAGTSLDEPAAGSLADRLSELHEESREGAQLLGLLAFLGSAPVPARLFSRADELLPEPLAAIAEAGAGAIRELAGRLDSMGLATLEEEGIRLPDELAAELRERMSAVERSRFSGTGVRLLHRAFPERVGRPGDRERCDALAPHVLAATRHPRAGGRAASETAHLLARLGAHESASGRPEAARRAFRRALEAAEAFDDSPESGRDAAVGAGLRAVLHDELAGVSAGLGRAEEAMEHAAAAEELADVAFGPESPRLPVLLRNLGSTYRELGRPGRAADCLVRAREAAERSDSPAARPLQVELGLAIADVRIVQERFEAAGEAAGRALSTARSTWRDGHPLTARAAWMLGDVRRALGDAPGATSLFRRALDAEEAARGGPHPAVGQKALALGLHLEEGGDREAALRRFRQAVEVFEATLSPEAEALRSARACLRRVEER